MDRIVLAMDSKSKESVTKALASLFEEINNALVKHRYLLINIIEGEHSQDRIGCVIAELALRKASLGYMPDELQETYEESVDASERISRCLETAREQSKIFMDGIKTLTEAANALKTFAEKIQ
jgi:transposase-like protein